MIWVTSSKHKSIRSARTWNSRSPGVAKAWREPALISRKGCSSAGRGWPNSLSQASDPIPITQERFPSISRKPTARNSAGRSPQNDRTASRLSSPGLTVATIKIAARVNAWTTACGAGGKPDCAPDAVNEFYSVDNAPLREGICHLPKIVGLRRKRQLTSPRQRQSLSLPGLACRDVGIPPRAHVGRAQIIAVHHIDRLAGAGSGARHAHIARLFAAFRRKPHAVVTPEARAFAALMRRPIRRIDAAAAPAVFHQKLRRRIGIERRDVIVDVAAERGADHFRLPQRQIIGLPDIVEIADLEHHVMDAVLAGVDEGKAVVARIDMKEIGLERL